MNGKRLLRRTVHWVLVGAWFVIGLPAQLILVALLCSLLPGKLGDSIAMASPFGLGALNYFVYQRLTRRRVIQGESERWLIVRSRRTPQQRARILRARQIGVWIPTVLVAAVFLFFPELLGIATHVFHPRPAKLIGYEVSFPVTWFLEGEGANEEHTWAFAGALDCRGPLRGGVLRFPFLTLRASAVVVMTSSSGGAISHRHTRAPLSTRSLLLAGEPSSCREYARDYTDWLNRDLRVVECRTSDERLLVSFAGEQSNLPDFYRSLESIRKLR